MIDEGSVTEQIVGRLRHPSEHLGRLVGPHSDGNLILLHSQECFDSPSKACPFSEALFNRGVNSAAWEDFRDVAVELDLYDPYGVIPCPVDDNDNEKGDEYVR